MIPIKIQVVTRQNYRTDVLVNDKFAYESFLHAKAEIKNLKHLIAALGLENIEIVEGEKI